MVQVIKPGDRLPVAAIDIPLGKSGEMRDIVIAGGCFWCTEAVYEMIDGVSDVASGYDGDTKEKANYEAVSTGRTKHAEAIRITYDAGKITYGGLLRVFFAAHDATTLNRQGADVGPQYRSAIFFANEEQKRVAEAYIKQLNDAKAFSRPIVTTVEPDSGFYVAEEYHQDFARRNPNYGYIRAVSDPKVEKVREKYGDLLKVELRGK